MSTEPKHPPHVVNVADAPVHEQFDGAHWGSRWQPLTPALDALKGERPRLGVNLSRVPPGHTACPFHTHLREDEAFYVLSGRGVLRLGDELTEIGPGDCIACPAGTGVAHQLANPYDEELVYLAMGLNDPHEVCTYPDSGKVLVRGLGTVGHLARADYMAGEPEVPKVLALARALRAR